MDMVYDKRVGAYRLAKWPGYYYFDNHFIHYDRGNWLVGKRINGRWRTARKGEVPRQLQKAKAERPEQAPEKNRLQGVWPGAQRMR
jgi:hypothetical protein